MKILLVTPYYYPKVGGLENYARQLALALGSRHGVEIVVVTSNHINRRTIIETLDGMTIYRLPSWFLVSNTPVNPLWPFMIRRIVKRHQPSIIHAHTPVPSMSDAAALAAGRTPFVLTYHAATLVKGGRSLFNLVAYVYGWYEKISFAKARRIFPVSTYVRDNLPQSAQAKAVVVSNAVWEHEIKARQQPLAPEFVFIGSLDRTHSWKGLEATIMAVRELRRVHSTDIRLTVIGDGNYRSFYEELATNLEVRDLITFVGVKMGDEKNAILERAMALIAYPVTGNDAFPTVFLEAWARYVPVIAAAIGPIPTLIRNEVTGYLVAPSSPTALAESIQKVMQDQPLRSRVAATAADMVRQRFTWEMASDAMANELEKLL